MQWWPTRKRDEDLERELQSDLELEEEEQRERGLPPNETRSAASSAVLTATPVSFGDRSISTASRTP
jgi:hypothetical protein